MRKLFNVLGLLAFLLVSCDNASVDEKVAQQNIQQYLEEMIGTNMPTGYVIDEYKHSKLYILEPKNESKIVKPKVEKGDTATEFEHLLHSMDNVVDNLTAFATIFTPGIYCATSILSSKAFMSGGAVRDLILMREAASSIRSIALSGRYLSVIYLSERYTARRMVS